MASVIGHTILANAGLTYANRVSELAQLQQSQLRGVTMATGFSNFTSWATGTTASSGWVSVDLAYEAPVKLTPIQEMRAGLKSWLG